MQNYESNNIENLPQPPIEENILPSEPLSATPDNPPWNSWMALLVWFASVAFIVVIPGLLVLPYLASQSTDFANKTEMVEMAQKDPTVILLNVLGVIPAHLLTLLLCWLVVTQYRKFSFRETLGWRWNGFNFWNCLIILGGFYILAAVAGHFFPEQENELLRILRSSRTALYVVAFLATFTAPLVEEVVYRGLLYSAFQRRFGVILAVALVTILFTAVHIPQYSSESVPNYASIITLLLLSLTLTLIRVRTGNLLPCIFLHTIINGIQSVVLILYPYLEKYIETSEPTASLVHFFK